MVEQSSLRRAAKSLAELSKIGTCGSSQTVLSAGIDLQATHWVACAAEDNVDQVVSGGAVQAVVPLLTFFKVKEGDTVQSR